MPVTLRYCTCPICNHRFRIKGNPTFIEDIKQNLYYAHCANCGRDLQVLESYTQTEEFDDSILYGNSSNIVSSSDLASIEDLADIPNLYTVDDSSTVATVRVNSAQLSSISAATSSNLLTRDEVQDMIKDSITEFLKQIYHALVNIPVQNPDDYKELNKLHQILQSVANRYGITLYGG